MREEIEILKSIDKYINGELSVAEVDQLWATFLEQPEYLDYLIIEATLRSTSWISESSLKDVWSIDSTDELC